MDKDFYKDIYQEFENNKQKFIDAEVPAVKTMDRYRGQPLNPEQFEYYELPAIFIERSIAWERDGQVYNGVLLLRFHVVMEPTWDTSNIGTNNEDGLNYGTFLDCTREVLDNMRRPYISTLFRTSDEPVDTGVIVYETLGYQCMYYGNTTIDPHYEDTPAPENVKILGRQAKTKKV